MLRRFNLAASAILMLGAAVAVGLAAPQIAGAAALSPGALEQAPLRPVASPVHCKPYFHCIKRCRRCVRICHRCPSEN